MKNLSFCNLCGNKLFEEPLTTLDYENPSIKKYDLYECKICGLFQQNPIPLPDEISSFYPESYSGNYVEPDLNHNHLSKIKKVIYELNRVLFLSHKEEVNFIKKYAKNNFQKNLDILDVGCGSGSFLIALKNFNNFNLYGIDIDEQVILHLKNQHAINGEVATLVQFKPNKKYDIIYMSHFLEHDPFPLETLSKARSLLKKGGFLIIKVPNIRSLSFKIFKKYTYFLDLPRHLFMYNPKTLNNYLEKAGFSKINIKTKIHNMVITSLLNIFNSGSLRSDVQSNFIKKLLFYSTVKLFSLLFYILFLPFYAIFEGEEVVAKASI